MRLYDVEQVAQKDLLDSEPEEEYDALAEKAFKEKKKFNDFKF